MSRPYELRATITVDAQANDLTVLRAILEDEEKRIGSRAAYTIRSSTDAIVLDVRATDAVALKTAVSAISAIIRTAEKMNTIGETNDGTPSASARDPR